MHSKTLFLLSMGLFISCSDQKQIDQPSTASSASSEEDEQSKENKERASTIDRAKALGGFMKKDTE